MREFPGVCHVTYIFYHVIDMVVVDLPDLLRTVQTPWLTTLPAKDSKTILHILSGGEMNEWCHAERVWLCLHKMGSGLNKNKWSAQNFHDNFLSFYLSIYTTFLQNPVRYSGECNVNTDYSNYEHDISQFSAFSRNNVYAMPSHCFDASAPLAIASRIR